MKTLSYILYRVIRFFVWLFYPKIEVVGAENLPADAPCIAVGNHAQMNGPIACELYFPGKKRIWCAGEMMKWKEVPAYAFSDFWSKKPKWQQPFFRLLSYLITPLCVCVFNNASTLPVYHDKRYLTTVRATLRHMAEGESMVIFPEKDEKANHILCAFQDRFVDIAKMHYKKAGQAVKFVPFYLAPKLKKLYIGPAVDFDPEAESRGERERICRALHETITHMAVSLPRHTVIPYRNIPKKDYPKNRP